MEDDLSARLREAYASGDPDRILQVISGLGSDSAGASPKPPSGSSSVTGATVENAAEGNKAESSSVPKLNPCANEFVMPGWGNTKPKEAQLSQEDTLDMDLETLRGELRHADSNTVHALLMAHGGNVGAARTSLLELDACGALGTIGDDDASAFDVSAFSAAMEEWDSEFPSLGGGGSGVSSKPSHPNGSGWGTGRQAAGGSGDGKLLESVREQSLVEIFPWISRETVEHEFQKSGKDHQRAMYVLRSTYPKPLNWDKERTRESQEAVRKAILQATANLQGDEYDADGGGSSGAAKSMTWVQTGDAVAKLYAEKRESAMEAARVRNKCFERAAVAARSGKGAEATRLGAQGRAAQQEMMRLHQIAADLLWKELNPNFVTSGQIDLHGLHVVEALDRLPTAFEEASQTRSAINIVFGTGHHSKGGGGAPRLRPAVLRFLESEGYSWKELADTKTRQVGAVCVRLV